MKSSFPWFLMVKLRETITVLNTGDSDSRCRDLARVPVADDQWQGLAMVAVVAMVATTNGMG